MIVLSGVILMIDLKPHIHFYKYITVESNGLQYKINHELQSDGTDEFWICTRNKCKSKHVQSYLLSRYSEDEKFSERIVVRGRYIRFN